MKRDDHSQHGFAHWIVPILIAVLIGSIGYVTLSVSNAQVLPASPDIIALRQPVVNKLSPRYALVAAQVDTVHADTVRSVKFFYNDKRINDVKLEKCYEGMSRDAVATAGLHEACWDTHRLKDATYQLTAVADFKGKDNDARSLAINAKIIGGIVIIEKTTTPTAKVIIPVSGTVISRTTGSKAYIKVTVQFSQALAGTQNLKFLVNGVKLSPTSGLNCYGDGLEAPKPLESKLCLDATSYADTIDIGIVPLITTTDGTPDSKGEPVVIRLAPQPTTATPLKVNITMPTSSTTVYRNYGTRSFVPAVMQLSRPG